MQFAAVSTITTEDILDAGRVVAHNEFARTVACVSSITGEIIAVGSQDVLATLDRTREEGAGFADMEVITTYSSDYSRILNKQVNMYECDGSPLSQSPFFSDRAAQNLQEALMQASYSEPSRG